MRHFLPLLCTILTGPVSGQGLLCDPAGDLILYSNYDGGLLTIDVDEDIPGLRIGVVSYEFVKVVVTGPFAGNVTRVDYAGFNGNNDHCGLGTLASTTIGGAPNAATTITFAPPASFANSNGYGSMICAYSCDVNSNQGGCNTADQVAHYFISTFGGDLRYHRTQYGCWQGVHAISTAGNCCENPLATGVAAHADPMGLSVVHDRVADRLLVSRADPFGTARWQVVDMTGRPVLGPYVAVGQRFSIGLEGLPNGIHTLKVDDGTRSAHHRFMVIR